MKKILSILLAFVLCIGLVACDNGVSGNPKDVITSMLNNFKNQNFEELGKYFDGNVDFNKDFTFDGNLDSADAALAKEFLNRLTDIDFEILDESISEDNKNSTVTIKITTHNIGEKLLEGVKEMVPLAIKLTFSQEEADEIKKQLFSALLKPVQSSTKSITKTISINLTNKNGEWKIGTNNNLEFLSSITGGFDDLKSQFDVLY